MPVFFNEVNITNSLAVRFAWETLDLSPWIPEDAEIVFLRMKNTVSDTIRSAVRCNGSTDNHNFGADPGQKDLGLHWQAVKVDANRRVQFFRGNAATQANTTISVYLFGYLTKKEAHGFINQPIFQPAAMNAWQTISLTSAIPSGFGRAYAALIQPIYTTNNAGAYGIRKTGSSGNIIQGQAGTVCGLAAIELNANNEIDVYRASDSTIAFFVVGFIKKDIVRNYSNPIVVSPTLTNSTYQDISVLPNRSVAGIYEITSTGRQQYNIRAKDSPTTNSPLGGAELHTLAAIVPVGTNNTIQAARNSTGITIYETGYWKLEDSPSMFFGTNF